MMTRTTRWAWTLVAYLIVAFPAAAVLHGYAYLINVPWALFCGYASGRLVRKINNP